MALCACVFTTRASVWDHLRQLKMTGYQRTDGWDGCFYHSMHLDNAMAQCDLVLTTFASVCDHLRQLKITGYIVQMAGMDAFIIPSIWTMLWHSAIEF